MDDLEQNVADLRNEISELESALQSTVILRAAVLNPEKLVPYPGVVEPKIFEEVEKFGEVEVVIVNENLDSGFGARFVSCFAYILPLLDGFNYGKHIVVESHVAAWIIPAVEAWNNLPGGSLFLFFIFASQGRNINLPALLRFNLQQAVTIDIFLFFPPLLGILPFDPQLAARISEPVGDIFFVGISAVVAYSILWTLLTGTYPDKVPVISDAAKGSMQQQQQQQQ